MATPFSPTLKRFWVSLGWVKNDGDVHFPSLSDLLVLLEAWHRHMLLGLAVLRDTHLIFYMPLADRLAPLTGVARGRQHLGPGQRLPPYLLLRSLSFSCTSTKARLMGTPR